MTTPQPKPLEFWIYHPMGYKDHETYPYYGDAVIKDLPVPIGFDFKLHVIEYSAYAQLRADLDEAIEALRFYAAFSTNENHQFIFDDENGSRAAVYEKYRKCSIGSLGIKAYETLESLRKRRGEG